MLDQDSNTGENRTIFTVSRLNTEVRRLLESHFGGVWLVGEISNFATPASGHWYFTLKDDKAQIRCAMFRGNNVRVQHQVGHGMQVMVRARISLYEPRGDYQLIVEHMEPAGEGLLQQQFEQLKAKLTAEGLFAQERKQPLPGFIRRLGVITSPSGAAIKDVLTVLKRRDPALEVIIYPAPVQGEEAPLRLREMLATAIRRNEVDALLITRGGGSLEDLWAFNNEQLARDIAGCPLPIVSAVGHETDITISDFVADVRAPTPSAAAELLSNDRTFLVQQHQQLRQRMIRAWQRLREQRITRLSYLEQRLVPLSPQQRLQTQQQQLDDMLQRMSRALGARFQQSMQRQLQLTHRLQQSSPAKQLPLLERTRQQLTSQATRAVTSKLNQANERFAAQQQALQIVSPLQTLARGYSITFSEDGSVIRKASELNEGDTIKTRLHEGEVLSEVKALKLRE